MCFYRKPLLANSFVQKIICSITGYRVFTGVSRKRLQPQPLAFQLLNSFPRVVNQYIFIDNPGKTIQKLESKRLRLQSLSAYSRENTIARDATNDFLNEAISQQRLPVKAHFNLLVWTDRKEELKDLKNLVSSGLAQIDAASKQETIGAAQIFWAGIPGNEADFPINDTFDTFVEQASCFLNQESNYRSSLS